MEYYHQKYLDEYLNSHGLSGAREMHVQIDNEFKRLLAIIYEVEQRTKLKTKDSNE